MVKVGGNEKHRKYMYVKTRKFYEIRGNNISFEVGGNVLKERK